MTYQTDLIFWGYGEIGKHAGFKIQCRKASRFKSEYPYHTIDKKFSSDIFFKTSFTAGMKLFLFSLLIICEEIIISIWPKTFLFKK